MKKISKILYHISIIVFFLVATFIFSLYNKKEYDWISAISLIISASIMIIIDIIQNLNIKKNDIEKEEINDYYNNAKKAILNNHASIDSSNETYVQKTSELKNLKIDEERNVAENKNINENDESNDIIELMLLNMKEIKEYYILSKTMARKSFALSVTMCILGFAVILSSIIAIFFIKIDFMESLVPVIGGTIVEIIAGTSLIVYKKSLEQLNKYYESLHNNERFLSAVNLVSKLSDDKKDDVYINIINNQLKILNNK